MRELVYYVAVTLDGYIATPDGGFDAFLVEGDHSSVVLGEMGDAVFGPALAALGLEPPRTRFDTVVMGWNALLPGMEVGIDSPYPHLRQYVASRSDKQVASDITLTHDPVATVRELKEEDGLDIWLCGGGELAGTVIDEIDRLVLKRNPFAFGSGIPLFGRAPYAPRRFDLVSARPFESGVVVEEYVARRDA
ncbi:dihydrofolate reductase family protein [Microbacterium sp.]|uniref:dihydrofolate reductase family protein n=1 Tax=Microbacterium sp. TaxID=51671 RepID=UPI00281249FC|nr:dihydrofolate reductase family protein [Microbacterium sp.]